MSNAVFPALGAVGWSVHRSPVTATRIFKSISGRTVRQSLMAQPQTAFELTYEVLRADAVNQELQTIRGFFLDRGGKWDSFLYQDPYFYQASAQALGTGDGVTTAFTFVTPEGSGVFSQPVGQVQNDMVSAPKLYLNGTLKSVGTDYTLSGDLTQVIFATAPAASVAVTATYQFYFRCCFDDDIQDYENFMYQLWTLKSCKFTSAKP